MGADLIVLNGGSSSGKTSIARGLQELLPRPLQELLPRPWLMLGIDDLLGAMPLSAADQGTDVVSYGPDGSATVGAGSRRWEGAWADGVAAMARAGTGVIAGREATRPDRKPGMATTQAEVLHWGVTCDVEVGTTSTCAHAVHAKATQSGRGAPSGAQGNPAGARPSGVHWDEQGDQWGT